MMVEAKEYRSVIPESSSNQCKGVIEDVIQPGLKWRVRFKGSYWLATSNTDDDFVCGEQIEVVGREGVKLEIASL